MKEYTDNGVEYGYELAGQMGARFWLIPGEQHTIRDINMAKHWLKQNHDVVGPIRIEKPENNDKEQTESKR